MDTGILQDKLLEYLNGELSREQLVEWAQLILNNMLTTKDIYKLKCLYTYPFISEISVNKNSWESVKKSTIETHIKILKGELDFNYCVIIKLGKHKKERALQEIMKILNNYISNGSLTDKEYDFLLNFAEKKQKNKVETLEDLVISNVVNYIGYLPKEMNQELGIPSLFVQEDIKNSAEYIQLTLNWLEAYLGEVNLYVNISYAKNENMLSLSI